MSEVSTCKTCRCWREAAQSFVNETDIYARGFCVIRTTPTAPDVDWQSYNRPAMANWTCDFYKPKDTTNEQ